MDTEGNIETRRFTKIAWCKKGQKIPTKKLAAAAKKTGKLGQRARLAQTLGKLGK